MSKFRDEQPRPRSETDLPSFTQDEIITLQHVSTRASQQLTPGNSLTREAAQLDLKRLWAEAKLIREAREIEASIVTPQSHHDFPHLSNEGTKFSNEEADPDLVDWHENDPENPQNLSFCFKAWITLLSCLLIVNVTFASSAPSSTLHLIAKEYGVSKESSVLMTSIFLCGYITGPILWAPASELLGRRPVLVGPILVYMLFMLGQALGKNFGTLIVTRFFSGLFGSAPITNCGGIVVDIWDPVSRGPAVSLVSVSVLLGPVLGPVVGGFVADSYLGWRWIFWIMMIFAGACWILLALFLPETYGPILLAKRARRLRNQDPEKNGRKYASAERMDFTLQGVLERTLYRPFLMLSQEPILVLITIYFSIVYGLLYALFSVFPIIWQQLRGFSNWKGGLIFIGVGIGSCIGAALSTYMQRHYCTLVPKWHGSPPPEERLPGAMIAGPLLVISIFWLGWAGAYPNVPWYLPALATIPLGMSFTLMFISYLTYIFDTYLLFSASALAANTIFRSAVGAAFPLFTSQMFSALGVQWACTLIGAIAIILLPIPFVFYKYGSVIREKSKFAPCVDLQIREQVEREEREILERGIIVKFDANGHLMV